MLIFNLDSSTDSSASFPNVIAAASTVQTAPELETVISPLSPSLRVPPPPPPLVASAAGSHLEFALIHFKTCPSVGVALWTLAKSARFLLEVTSALAQHARCYYKGPPEVTSSLLAQHARCYFKVATHASCSCHNV